MIITANTLPNGTVTFLFTDIAGSTTLWEAHPEAMRPALGRHDVLLKDAIEAGGGYFVKVTGDGVLAAFHTATAALSTALAAQQALQAESWPQTVPIAVRMGLHTGAAEAREGDYFGPVLNRAARLMAAGHGGQVLLSIVTQELCRDDLPDGATLLDLGSHHLKDLERPEHLFQLVHPTLTDTFPPLRTLDNAPNNLSPQVTSFIGRETEIAEITALLAKTRLLMLTGSGGSGKTRLALQVAADALEGYQDGVWLIELGLLSDASLVPQTIASALGVKEHVGQTMAQTLMDYLKAKRLLLVLDNCEHLLSVCAQLVAALIRVCPQIKVLATGREPLGIAGETTYRVPSLSLPTTMQARNATVDSVSQFEAVRLFIERAHSVKPDFVVTSQNAPFLAQVCYQLDGIPLAIELAAARARSLAVEQINDKLDSRFRLLTGGDRAALPRQQTLRALVDWSYDLLSDTEKALFARLSIFVGGWTLEAAESVCGFDPIEDWEVLDLLTSLVDKSLVVAETTEDTNATRYRMLETLRQYGREKRKASDDAAEVQTRYQDYFVTFAEGTEPKLTGPEQSVWLDHLECEHENLRTVLESYSAATNAEEAEASLRLAGALWRFWSVRGYFSEGREQITRALGRGQTEGSATPGTRARALNGAGYLAFNQGDYVGARLLLDESLSLFRALGDKHGMATVLNTLGNAANSQGDYTFAQSLYEESLTLFRTLVNLRGIAASLCNLGRVAHNEKDYSTAQSFYEEGLALYRELNSKEGIANSLSNLGNVTFAQKDYVAARLLYEQGLFLYRELGHRYSIAYCLEGIASVGLGESLGKEDSYRAVVLLGSANALRETIGAPLSPADQADQSREIIQARSTLGEASYATAWDEGYAMPMEQAIDYALKGNPTMPSPL